MATSFVETLRDEILRIEIGSPVLSDLAVENVELSTPAMSRAVRRSVIERRVIEPVVRMPGPNRLEMNEVALPGPVSIPCAA
jgi:hypothetical protein